MLPEHYYTNRQWLCVRHFKLCDCSVTVRRQRVCVCVSDCSDTAARSVRSVFMLPQHYTNRQWLCVPVWHLCECGIGVTVTVRRKRVCACE